MTHYMGICINGNQHMVATSSQRQSISRFIAFAEAFGFPVFDLQPIHITVDELCACKDLSVYAGEAIVIKLDRPIGLIRSDIKNLAKVTPLSQIGLDTSFGFLMHDPAYVGQDLQIFTTMPTLNDVVVSNRAPIAQRKFEPYRNEPDSYYTFHNGHEIQIQSQGDGIWHVCNLGPVDINFTFRFAPENVNKYGEEVDDMDFGDHNDY